MTDLFTRYSATPFAGTVSRDTQGKPYFMQERSCSRCGGAGGADKWKPTGWTCFDCGGSGKHPRGPERVRLYTADELVKLNATQEKRTAKRTAAADVKAAVAKAEVEARRQEFETAHGALMAQAEAFCDRSEFVRDVVRKARERATLTEKQETALRATVAKLSAEAVAKAASGYVGAVGKRVECKVQVARVASFTRQAFGPYGGVETVWILTMRDEAGNAIVSKTPRFHAEKGESFTLRATVKEHSEYDGEKQTVVQRCAAV